MLSAWGRLMMRQRGLEIRALSPSRYDGISTIVVKDCGVQILVNWERLKLELTNTLDEVGLGLDLSLSATSTIVSLPQPWLRVNLGIPISTLWATHLPDIFVGTANEGPDVSGRFKVAIQEGTVRRSLGLKTS